MIKYLSSTYKDGGRGENGQYDCWGLARAARHELYGRPLLPKRPGPHRLNIIDYQRHYNEQIKDLSKVEKPTPGCLVFVLDGRLCGHVALVVDDVQRTGLGLHVIDTNPEGGAVLQSLNSYIKKHSNRTLHFYDD